MVLVTLRVPPRVAAPVMLNQSWVEPATVPAISIDMLAVLAMSKLAAVSLPIGLPGAIVPPASTETAPTEPEPDNVVPSFTVTCAVVVESNCSFVPGLSILIALV